MSAAAYIIRFLQSTARSNGRCVVLLTFQAISGVKCDRFSRVVESGKLVRKVATRLSRKDQGMGSSTKKHKKHKREKHEGESGAPVKFARFFFLFLPFNCRTVVFIVCFSQLRALFGSFDPGAEKRNAKKTEKKKISRSDFPAREFGISLKTSYITEIYRLCNRRLLFCGANCR